MDKNEEGKRFWKFAGREAAKIAKANPRFDLGRKDSEALAGALATILTNKRLSWEVVSACHKQNHKLLVDDPNTIVA